jgi:hypothetical protein
MIRGFKECFACDEMAGRKDEEEVGNVGSEHGSVNMRQYMGIMKMVLLRHAIGMVNRDW